MFVLVVSEVQCNELKLIVLWNLIFLKVQKNYMYYDILHDIPLTETADK